MKPDWNDKDIESEDNNGKNVSHKKTPKDPRLYYTSLIWSLHGMMPINVPSIAVFKAIATEV
jgi:hypothetical protein